MNDDDKNIFASHDGVLALSDDGGSGDGEKGALPLKNKRRELFCNLYSDEYWGLPEKAAVASGYSGDKGNLHRLAKSLLSDDAVLERLAFLREKRSRASVADDAWIKDALIDIARNADKPSDRIRALANLNRVVSSGKKRKSSSHKKPEQNPYEVLLPLFQGEEDGCNADEKSFIGDASPSAE